MAGSKPISTEQLRQQDMETLLKMPEFLRFVFELIQQAGLFSATTDGSVGRDQFNLGRRNLGFQILDLIEEGQPVKHPGGMPLLTLIQVFREEALKPTENRNDQSQRYDRRSELDASEDDDPS